MSSTARDSRAEFEALVGTVIADRFVVERFLASGGMGAVYEAEQRPLGRKVALKVLRSELLDDDDAHFAKRFANEASLTAKLKHPHVVTIHDYGTFADGHYFIAMELLEGPDLGELVTRDGPLNPERGRRIALQVARGLMAAHEKRLIHRDLKPANIIITRDEAGRDHAVVLDFGLAKDRGVDRHLTQEGSFLGSPKYMAPEQVRSGSTVDERADIYAFGVTLFAALTGRVPYDGGNLYETVRLHIEAPIPPVRRADGVEVPRALEMLVHDCMRKLPQERPPSMEAIVRRLESMVTRTKGLETRRTPPSGEQRTALPAPAGIDVELTANAAPPRTERVAQQRPPEVDTTNLKRVLTGIGLFALLSIGIVGAWYADARRREATRRVPVDLPVVPAPEAPTARRTVALRIQTTPPGSEVFLGARPLGLTPLDTTIEVEEESTPSIRVIKLGYWPETVFLQPDQPTVEANLTLRRRR